MKENEKYSSIVLLIWQEIKVLASNSPQSSSFSVTDRFFCSEWWASTTSFLISSVSPLRKAVKHKIKITFCTNTKLKNKNLYNIYYTPFNIIEFPMSRWPDSSVDLTLSFFTLNDGSREWRTECRGMGLGWWSESMIWSLFTWMIELLRTKFPLPLP